MEDGLSRKLAVILHADVVGSTALVQRNETLAHERIQDAFQRLSQCIEAYGGTAHEIRGDALVAEFARASDAVCAALSFQADNQTHNQKLPDDVRPEVRVGIGLGEEVIANGTVTGAGVVVAQRLEQLAKSGGVVVQGAIYEAMPKRFSFTYESIGEQSLKGLVQPVRAFVVSLETNGMIPSPDAKQRAVKTTHAETMDVALLKQHGFHILGWTVRPLEGRLSNKDTEQRVSPKAVEVLLVLSEHPGRVYAREEILQKVWGERAVSDEPLTRCISELRTAFGDSRKSPRVIETISKRGYRLVATVESLGSTMSESKSSDEPEGNGQRAALYQVPSVPSRFIGRADDLGDIRALLHDPEIRLVNLVGPGGTGKTRLALEAACTASDYFADGVATVMLAPVQSPDLVVTTIMATLGLPEVVDRSPTETLASFLADRQLLLVLDNFEHVVDAAPLLRNLLTAASNLNILITSREVLHLTGEIVYQVPPLEVPPQDAAPEVLKTAESVRLFIERSRATGRELDLSDDQLEVIVEICRRLEGLPLAIELAAARTRIFDPDEIRARLDFSFQLLTGGPRDLPPRQQALDLTIQWSYDLLPDAERALFEVVSVFVGGFSLGAAEEVAKACGLGGVLDGITGLVDRSLLTAQGTVAGESRYLMLETVREFAQQRLEQVEGMEAARRAHARHFLEDTVARRPGFEHGKEALLAARYDADRGNLRAAIRFLLELNEMGDVSRLGFALWQYWWFRSLFEEGIKALQKARSMRAQLSDQDYAEASFALGMCHIGLGEYEKSQPILVEAQNAYRQVGDEVGAAICACPLGVIAALHGDPEVEQMFQRTEDILRRADYSWGLALALFCHGRVLVDGGRFSEAVVVLEESVERARGTEVFRSHALVNLGWACRGTGDLHSAVRVLIEALDRLVVMENPQGIARVFEGLVAVMLDMDRVECAGEFFGAAEAARRVVGAPVWTSDILSHTALENTLQERLSLEGQLAAWTRGLALEIDQAVSLAHRVVKTEQFN